MPPQWETAKETLFRQFLSYERIGVITDMDGVLAPIVPVPSDATPTAKNRELLRALHEKMTLVAVVSGRAADDVAARVNLPQLVYAGNHGLERWQDGQVVVAPAVAAHLDDLQAAKKTIEAQQPEGMWVEDKGATLSVHYRNTANPAQIAQAYLPVMQEIADMNNLRVFQGRMIFELRPPLDMDKGTVFKQLIEEHDLQAAIYAGDDTTDADALKMARTLREQGSAFCIGVGVTAEDTPDIVIQSADVLTAGVPGVEALFAWLLSALSAS